MSGNTSTNNQHGIGISGYRLITNSQLPPRFHLYLPENWQYDIILPRDKKGFLLSIRGPLNELSRQYTCLFISLEEDIRPSISLDEISKNSIKSKRYGDSTIFFERPVTVSKMEGREVRMKCETVFHAEGKQIPVSNLLQWTVLRFNSHIIRIEYLSAEESFEEFLPVYTKAVETFAFLS